MKHLVASLLSLFALEAYAGVAQTLLICSNKENASEFPTYTLSYMAPETGDTPENGSYIIRVSKAGKTVAEELIPARYTYFQSNRAVIFSVDLGRSGFAHFYSHGETAIVDLAIFGGLQTNGPVTNLICFGEG